MIHYALLTCDGTGRNAVESRVFDLDPTDGLDPVGRVNAGIDLMLDAARDADLRVGPIGITARTATQRRRLRSGGTGTRRQVHLSSDDEAVTAFLTRTGQIDRFASVVVADVGDTGMSLYLVDPNGPKISAYERSAALSGRQIDEALADHVSAAALADGGGQTRRGRAALVSACRTAKEEPGETPAAHGAQAFSVTAAAVDEAARPFVADAREAFTRFVADARRAAGPHPEAAVLVGGLANLRIVADVAADTDLDVIVPQSPELAAATGAAMLAGAASTNRLAFIGGRRTRSWFAAPVVVAAGFLCAVLMAAVAVGATLTDEPDPVPSPTSVSVVETVQATRDTGWTTTSTSRTRVSTPAPRPTVPAVTTYLDPQENPGWATTEIPPTTTSTTTLTLVPGSPETSTSSETSTPIRPTLPIPSGLIPPGLLPTTLPPETTAPGIAPNIELPDQSDTTTTTTPAR